MSQTTALLCEGDERTPGCGEPIAMLDRGRVIRAGGGDILSYDRLGRARIACRCGAVTMMRGSGKGDDGIDKRVLHRTGIGNAPATG